MQLNKVTEKEINTVYPWIHNLSNCMDSKDLLKGIRIPDVVPSVELEGSTADFSFGAGEFCQVYGKDSQRGQWNAAVTCFFLGIL